MELLRVHTCIMGLALHLVLWAQVLLHFACPAQPASSGGQLWNIADATFIDECVQTHNSLRSSVDPPASNMSHMVRASSWKNYNLTILLEMCWMSFLPCVHNGVQQYFTDVYTEVFRSVLHTFYIIK